jgi:ankyrin repeat protein
VQYGETPLHLAAKNGSTEAVKLLLKYNAFKEAKANVSIPEFALIRVQAIICLFLYRFGARIDLDIVSNYSRDLLTRTA